jgi:hypothetical protein
MVLGGEGWRGILADLAGYQPAFAPGEVLVMTAALPWWHFSKAKIKSARPALGEPAPLTAR